MDNILKQLSDNTALLLDVRTKAEWDESHAKGALHWELGTPLLPEINSRQKNTPIYTYCRSGARSEQAKNILLNEGFASVTNIGGLVDWISNGGEVLSE